MERKNLEYPLLVTDCSAPGARVGLMDESGWLAYGNYSGEVSSVLFDAVKDILTTAESDMNLVKGFVFCEGPGSTMGIRINAMAIRTWNSLEKTPRPVCAFKSLEAAAVLVQETSITTPPYAVFSDLRKDVWNACKVEADNRIATIELVTKSDLDKWPERRFFVQQRLYSPGSPPQSKTLDYDLKPLASSESFTSLMHIVEKPTAFQTMTTEFKKWVPQRHR